MSAGAAGQLLTEFRLRRNVPRWGVIVREPEVQP
jgi:hypothetical protein